MSEMKLGKITTTPKGEWSSTASYERLDIVQLKGTSWIAKRANTGVEPTEGDDWMLSAEGAPQIDDTAVSAETPWSSKNTVDRFCPEITGEGNPVVLENCVEGYPLDVTASWEVQQEGSGTPHLAGCGVNQWKWGDAEGESSDNFGYPYIVNTADFPDDFVNTPISIKCFDYQGANTTLAYDTVCFYSESAECWLDKVSDGKTFTLTAKPTRVYFYVGSMSPTPAGGHYRKIMMVKGSTIPTEYDPYEENIRPIVARKSVTVDSYNGKNLLDVSKCKPHSGVYNLTIELIDGDIIHFYGTPNVTTAGHYWMAFLEVPDYSLSGKGYKITYYPIGDTPLTSVYGLRTADERAIATGINLAPDTAVDFKFRIMVSVDTPTEYEPFKGQSQAVYTPSIATAAGSFDKDGNGTEDLVFYQFDGTEDWKNTTATTRYWAYLTKQLGVNLLDNGDGAPKMYCDRFVYESMTNYKNMVGSCSHDITPCFNTPYATVDEWKAYLAEQYAAGTPVTMACALQTKRTFTVSKSGEALAYNPITCAISDADTMTVSAREDPIKIIANLTDRISALEAAATDISEV
jgi:hypothetical protein